MDKEGKTPEPEPRSEPPQRRRSRRMLRWPTRILAIVGIVAIVLVLVQFFVLRPVVRVVVHRALTDFGFENVSFDVRRVSFVHTDIENFRLDGEGVNRVGRLSADYTLRTLLDGRIKSLRVERAQVQIMIAPDGSVDFGALDLSAGKSSKKESPPASDGRLPFDRLELVDSTLNVLWEDRRIALPVRGSVWDLGGQKSSIEFLAHVRDKPLRIEGTLEQLGRKMEISAEGENWRIADVLATIPERLTSSVPGVTGTLNFEGSYRTDGTESLASARMRAVLAPPTTQPVAEVTISGLLRGEASVRMSGGQVQPLVTISAKELNVADPEYGYDVRGISGSVTLNSLSPLTSAAGQRLDVAEADVGQLKLRGGVLIVGLESATSYLIEKLEANYADGRMTATPFRVDMTKPVVETVLAAQNVDLKQMLATFAEKQVTGSGRVSGQLPLRLVWRMEKQRGQEVINWGEPRLVLGEGVLRAEPGGYLSLADPEALLGDHLENDPAYRKGGQMESVKKDLMASLKNLKYSTLRLQFVERNGNLVPSVRIAGKGQGPRGREIDLTINLNGFEGLLKRATSIGKIFG
jgi:hypothetical protein